MPLRLEKCHKLNVSYSVIIISYVFPFFTLYLAKHGDLPKTCMIPTSWFKKKTKHLVIARIFFP